MTSFDSNILIYFIENDTEFGLNAAAALAQAVDESGVQFSCLALTELHAHKQTPGQLTKLEQLRDVVAFMPIDELVATTAGNLRRTHPSLKIPEAIHIAAAVVAKAEAFVTNDKQLCKLKIPGITIRSLA